MRSLGDARVERINEGGPSTCACMLVVKFMKQSIMSVHEAKHHEFMKQSIFNNQRGRAVSWGQVRNVITTPI